MGAWRERQDPLRHSWPRQPYQTPLYPRLARSRCRLQQTKTSSAPISTSHMSRCLQPRSATWHRSRTQRAVFQAKKLGFLLPPSQLLPSLLKRAEVHMARDSSFPVRVRGMWGAANSNIKTGETICSSWNKKIPPRFFWGGLAACSSQASSPT